MSTITWNQIINYSHAPTTCGVYQYWDHDKLLYIGKAINLSARLASHAQNAKLDEKERAIVENATVIRYTETDSEFLALLLEAELIRKHQPPYNRIWKDDKSYLYIVIDLSDHLPRPHMARAHELTQNKSTHLRTFGPFPNTIIAEEILRHIRRLIPFCMSKRVGKHACFYSKIGLCNPCPADIVKTSNQELKRQYRKQIRQVINILSGKIDPVIKDLSQQMKTASAVHDYEKALSLRTKIERFTRYVSSHTFRDSSTFSYNTSEIKLNSLQSLLQPLLPQPSPLTRIEFYDASNAAFHDSSVSLVVSTNGLLDRGEYRRFKIRSPRAHSDFDRLKEALSRRFKNKAWPKPDLIVIDGGTPQLRTIQPLLDALPEPPLLLGLAKHPDRLVNYAGDTVPIDLSKPGYLLLTELRDEAHRFANNYRRLLESKRLNLKY